MTRVDQAQKLSESFHLKEFYEILCDAVHPSLGSNGIFFSHEFEKLLPRRSVKFRIDRRASGLLIDLPYVIAKTSLWAMDWLGKMWGKFEVLRNDLFLTGKLYALPGPPYSGVFSPDRGGEYCACGGWGQQRDKCVHKFGG